MVWNETVGVNEINEYFRKELESVAEWKIGVERQDKRRRKKQRWWNEDIVRTRKERKECNRKCRGLRRMNEDNENVRKMYEEPWIEYKRKQDEVKGLIHSARARAEKEVVDEL